METTNRNYSSSETATTATHNFSSTVHSPTMKPAWCTSSATSLQSATHYQPPACQPNNSCNSKVGPQLPSYQKWGILRPSLKWLHMHPHNEEALVSATSETNKVSKKASSIKHICSSTTTTSQAYLILIQHYQLLAGLSTPILENTASIPWSLDMWLDTACSFLHSINGQIVLYKPWTVKPQ